MADYINKNILSQAYIHIEPQKLKSKEELAQFKVELEAFVRQRSSFFLSPDLPIEIEFEEGSLIARITVLGTISVLFQFISGYKDFREGIQFIYADTKRVTDYIISHTTFESGAMQQDVIRLEARVGIIGSIQKSINQLEAITDLQKLMDNISDASDKKLVGSGLLGIANEIPFQPKAPEDKVNSLETILGFQRRRQRLLEYLKQYS
ncbi:hypothetical protein [Vibrio paracholerae]|uniref:hypothetical protein n=1 Tax=Vibrio paracholerae TaxID=650003 RepID=UPI000DE25E9C|nr:hypothetical protein [Vibrio paracholerae]RBM83980.1 hypothetical protein DLR74_18265 [Vibrio paracholerae]